MAIGDVARPTEMQLQVSRMIGKGGFGSVYLANQQIAEDLYRPVAIKVLKRAIARDVDALNRLMDEGRILSKLYHPCIVRILQLAHIGDDVALITEYVPGSDLAAFLKPENLLPTRAVWQIGSDVCSALHCAWTTVSDESGAPLKLIHRDIKPQNVRLGPYGEVKVLDFGIARSTEMRRMAHTQNGVLPGTVAYLPPEALAHSQVNETTDLYALACTLFNLLTGQRLNSSDPVTVMGLAMDGDAYGDHLQARLEAVEDPTYAEVLRMALDFDPSERPSHMEFLELCDELAFQARGPSLRLWAARQPRSVPESRMGPLSGKQVSALLVAQVAPAVDDMGMTDTLSSVNTPRLGGDDSSLIQEQEHVPTVIASPDLVASLGKGSLPGKTPNVPQGPHVWRPNDQTDATPTAERAETNETPKMSGPRSAASQPSHHSPSSSLRPAPAHDRDRALEAVDLPALPEPTALQAPDSGATSDHVLIVGFVIATLVLLGVIVLLGLAAAQLVLF